MTLLASQQDFSLEVACGGSLRIRIFSGLCLRFSALSRGFFQPSSGLQIRSQELAFLTLRLTLAVATYVAGSGVVRRRYHTFCVLVAGVNCVGSYLGILLAVYAFAVLF